MPELRPIIAEGTWIDDENDAIVVDYFTMLAEDLFVLSSTKAEFNRSFQTRNQTFAAISRDASQLHQTSHSLKAQSPR
ncbi:MAG: hypothetical protein LC676_08580 [Loktanella sp.]|nr:hypothetical protein [Loktanella sp.]